MDCQQMNAVMNVPKAIESTRQDKALNIVFFFVNIWHLSAVLSRSERLLPLASIIHVFYCYYMIFTIQRHMCNLVIVSVSYKFSLLK